VDRESFPSLLHLLSMNHLNVDAMGTMVVRICG
jgi:hypothetical protein